MTAAPLEHARRNRLSRLKQYRDLVIEAGVTVDGIVFDSDPMSAAALGTAIAATKRPRHAGKVIGWKGRNGDYLDANHDRLVEIDDEIFNHTQRCRSIERYHKIEIEALETVEAIEAYDITTEWPYATP